MYWGIGITVLWLFVIFLFWFFGDLDSPDSLNELGDFLAGIFAPVAFLWLVLGYIQQGRQLEQNTKALELQERASENHIKAMISQVKPFIKIENFLAQIIDGNFFKFTIAIQNDGVGDARNINLICEGVSKSMTLLRVDSKGKIELEIKKEDFDWSFDVYEYSIYFYYNDIFENLYNEQKKLIIYNNGNRMAVFETKITDIH